MDALTVRDLLYMGFLLVLAVGAIVGVRVTVAHLLKTQDEHKTANDKALEVQKFDFDNGLREQKEVELRHHSDLLSKINGIGKKLDDAREKASSRYMKMSMAILTIALTLPEGNPHKRDITKLANELVKENGGG